MTAEKEVRMEVSPTRRRVRRLRITAVIILLVGILGAALVYGLRSGPTPLVDDPSTLGYDKAVTRQAETLFGTSGVWVQEWTDKLRDPGVQAILILMAAGLVSAGCAYVAFQLDYDEAHRDKGTSPEQ
jgi:hypothetical protein